MILIRRAIAIVVVLNLLLPPSFQAAVSTRNSDEISSKTEVGNVQNKGLKNDEFKCSSGETIALSKVCDGKFDCLDRADENCYSGKCDNITNNCQCTEKCINPTQSYFYLFKNDENQSKSYVHVKHGDEMILECPIFFRWKLLEAINWYRNNMRVPSKCQITAPTQSNWVSRLHCPNMTTDDEGMYDCEQKTLNLHSHRGVLAFVKEQSFFELDSCFCFGATTDCQKINTTINYKEVQMLSRSSPPILISMQDNWKTINPNYTIFKGKNIETISQSEADETVYYALSEKITEMRLELYGGYFSYELFMPFQKPTIKNGNAPLAVMRGDDKVLIYRENGYFSENSESKRLSFSKHNWHILHKNTVAEESASAADVMRVLGNLDGIYVRLDYDVNNFVVNYTMIEIFLVEFLNNGSGRPSSIGRCFCPPEYAGNYCEKCAANYTGNPVKNTSCVSRDDGKKSTTDEEGRKDSAITTAEINVSYQKNKSLNYDYFQCYDNRTLIPTVKACDGHFDCENGEDEICYPGKCGNINECQCAYTKQCIQRSQSHFYLFYSNVNSNLSIHVNPGDFMILECPVFQYRLIEIHWYRNNLPVPDKCLIINPTKSSYSSSRLYCPNMTVYDEGVYSCDEKQIKKRSYRSSDLLVFVKDKSIMQQDSCFCFGVSNVCEKTNVIVNRVEVPLFSYDMSPILLTINDGGVKTLNYSIFVGKDITTVSELKANGTIYYALSNEIIDKKLKLYGGYFTYNFHYRFISPETTDPLVVMRGNGKLLAYYQNEKYKNLRHQKVTFSKHNWYIQQSNNEKGKKAGNGDIIEVLTHLDAIYVSLHYVLNDAHLNRIIDLFTIELVNSGLDTKPSTIGKCFCPLGYTGNYCEQCAKGYTGEPIKNDPCVYSHHHHVDSDKPVSDDSNINKEGNNTEFECNNGVTIEFAKVCDGILNCADGADEKCITGACDSFNECKCEANNKCIRRKESDFYLFNDDGDLPLNLYTLPGLPMTLQCPTVNAVDTKWYWNNETVPSDCTTVNHTDNSTLFCPNATSLHEGVYSCERYYDSSESDPETIRTAVLVGEEAFYKQGSCFCFGASVTSCELVNVSTSFQYCQRFQSSSPAAVLAALNGQLTLFPIDGERSQVDELNGAVYYALSDDITNLKLKLYGGFIPIGSVEVKQRIGGTNVNAPLAVMHGDGRVLLYYQDGKYGSTVNHGGLIFSAPNWIMLHRDGTVSRVTTRDMMKVLSHLDAIYVSDVPAGNEYKNIYSKVQFGSTELGIPLPAVPKCSCPSEYAGIYCEKCAENCSGDPMNNVPCVPNVHKAPMNTDDTLEEIDEENPENEADDDFTCSDGLRAIPFSEVCDGSFNCRDGSDEMCFHDDSCYRNECRCANTGWCIPRHRSHFYLFEQKIYSTPRFMTTTGDSMILECPINSLKLDEPIRWYQNDRSVPSKCQITQPTESNWRSRLTCPNMTIEDQAVYSCEENDMGKYRSKDVLAYLWTGNSHPRNPCFCFGVTNTCQSNALVGNKYMTIKMFSYSSPLYLSISEENGKIIVPNSTMLESGNLSTKPQAVSNTIPFYPLSEVITNMKLELNNGYLSYYNLEENKPNVPFALMRGDNKVLVYYQQGTRPFYSNELYFSMYNWFTVHGETKQRVSQEDYMRVLNNLDGIYSSRVFYDANSRKYSWNDKCSFHSRTHDGWGYTQVMECSCPTGYAGTYCERCAENYSGDPVNGKSCIHGDRNITNVEETTLEVFVPDNDFILLNSSFSPPNVASAPNPNEFLFRSFDCLLLYFCSLAFSILWYKL